MGDNNMLPNWLNCHINYKTIHLYGTPTAKDAGSIKIRITNYISLIMREFIINVAEPEELK